MSEKRRIFDDLYSASIDPWSFRTSRYEREKYHQTMEALPAERYKTVAEAGCSIGELSRLLGARCDNFYGFDVSLIAVAEARRRNADRSNMKFFQAELPQSWPHISADLIVLSEFLYFLSKDEISELARRIVQTWKPLGDCVVVSFLGNISGPLQGAESAELMIADLRSHGPMEVVSEYQTDWYRIDVVKNRSRF